MKNKIILLFVMLCIFCFRTNAQNSVRSIFAELDTIKSDTIKIDALCLKAWQTRKSDYQLSSSILDSIEYLLDNDIVKYDFIRPNIYLIRANSLGFLGNQKEMFSLYEKAIKLYDRFAIHPDKAIRQEAIRKKSVCYNNLAQTYVNDNQIQLAIEMYRKSLAEVFQLNNEEQLSIRYFNLGLAFLDYHELAGYIDSAEYYLIKSYKIEQQINNEEGLYWANHGMGQLYQTKNDYLKALDFYKKSLQYAEQLGYDDMVMEADQYVGECYNKLGDVQEATNYYQRALKIGESIDAKSALNMIYPSISDLYVKRENYKMANFYKDKLIALRDTLEKYKSEEQLAKFHAQFENEKKQQQIELLKRDKDLADKQKRIFIGGIIAAILVILLILNQIRLQRKSNKRLVEKNKTIRIQNQEIVEKNLQITDSISYAQKIQSAILPPESEFKKQFQDHFIFFKPKDIVSGDFYWIHNLGDETILAVVDCTGHGVPGAFMSLIGSNMLDKIVKEQKITAPNLILDQLNVFIAEKLRGNETSEVKDGMDLAIININKISKIVQIAGAYNPVYMVRDNKLEEYKGDKLHIGNLEHTQDKKYKIHEVECRENDCFYLLTDGYADQKGGAEGKKFFYPPLRELLCTVSEKSMSNQSEVLKDEMIKWKGDREQIDDMLIIGIRI